MANAPVNNGPTTPKMITPSVKAEEVKKLNPEEEAKLYAEEVRLRRGDIRTMESKLYYVGQKPGWTRRWVNDTSDNVPTRLAEGWRFVPPSDVSMSLSVGYGNSDIGDRVSIVTSVGEGPMRTYLMEIPTELAEEILEARSGSQVRKIEDAIRSSSIGVTSKNAYNPGEYQQSSFYGTKNTLTTTKE